MIDIHTHILPGVDDGAKDMDMALLMLRQQVLIGVTDVILTPHFKRHNIEKTNYIEETFSKLKQAVTEENLPINLYLGKEVYFKDQLLDLKDTLAFDHTTYTLVEFSTTHEQSIEETVFNLKVLKLRPIVAHIERYPYLKKSDYHSIKRTGGQIQINAASLYGLEGFKRRKLIHYLLKESLVDYVASDCHNLTDRKPNLKKAYQKVLKKYGKVYADQIFYVNQKKILDSIKA